MELDAGGKRAGDWILVFVEEEKHHGQDNIGGAEVWPPMGSHEARQAPPTMTGGSHSHHQSFYSLDSLEIICFFYFSKQKKLVHGSYYMDIIFRINFVNPYLLFCLTVHLN